MCQSKAGTAILDIDSNNSVMVFFPILYYTNVNLTQFDERCRRNQVLHLWGDWCILWAEISRFVKKLIFPPKKT